MATRKRSRKNKAAARRLPPMLSTAVGSLVNMTVTVITSATVLLCLIVVKRFS